MPWLKRNLFLIGWGVLALGLTVVAFIFLYGQKDKDKQTNETLEQETQELQRLYKANPHPNPDNVQVAKGEQERVLAFLNEAKKFFAAPAAVKLDDATFKRMVDDTAFGLTRDARAASVTLPLNYEFTFAVQRRLVRFQKGSLEPLAARLEEVKSLCTVLYQARVHSLDGIRRVAISTDDAVGTTTDYLVDKPVTNAVTGMVRIPYEITFTGFSSQLAAVQEGLLRSPQFFVVKDVTVEPAALVSALPPGAARPPSDEAPEGAPPAAPTAPGVRPTPPPGKAGAGGRPGMVTILDEKRLKITMLVDAVGPSPVAAASEPPK